MAIVSLATIKGWFKKFDKPTEAQFNDTFDSLRHKNDAIAMTEVTGLDAALASTVNTTQLNAGVQDAKDYADDADGEVLQDAKDYTDAGLALKLDAAAYNDRFKGKYITSAALITAHPTANDGDYAIVNAGGGVEAKEYIWDTEEGWVLSSGTPVTDSDSIIEGATNLYYTAARSALNEKVANKDTDATFAANSDTKYPSQKAVKTAIDLKLSISAAAAYILATVLTGFSVPASSAVIATDSILAAFGKIQAQINANVTALATKATIGGDAPAGTYRLGTSNANSFALRTNGVDRLTIDAAGNIVQNTSSTNFDIQVLRIRNLVGAFWRVFTNTITGQLDLGGDFTEVNFTKPITNLKGTNNRFVETDSAGNPTAIEKIISHFIYNVTAQGLLSDSTNWNNANVYTGASLATYALEQGQYYCDSLYEYHMHSTVVPIRIPRFRVARRLHNDYTSHKNVTTTLTDLINYNLPASTLNKNGDAVEMIIEGQFITPTSASFTVNVGGTPFYSKTGVAASEFVRVAVKLVRTASNVQTLYLNALYSDGTVDSLAYSGTAFTDTSVINVLVTGQDTVAGDTVEVKLFEVDFKPSL